MEPGDDHAALAAAFAATRALVRAASPDEVAAVVATLVHDLGGALVPARLVDVGTTATLPLDVSLGLFEPTLPTADPVSLAAMRLESVLPEFVEDARHVLYRMNGTARRTSEADRDVLTGLLNRRAWMRRLGAATAGDALCIIDLDHFKSVNDDHGHAAGDWVLSEIGALLAGRFRSQDACGRYGGDEFVCLTTDLPVHQLAERIDATRHSWELTRPGTVSAVGLSVGVAAVGGRGPRVALQAADRALYRVKNSGRNRTAIATEDDYRDR